MNENKRQGDDDVSQDRHDMRYDSSADGVPIDNIDDNTTSNNTDFGSDGESRSDDTSRIVDGMVSQGAGTSDIDTDESGAPMGDGELYRAKDEEDGVSDIDTDADGAPMDQDDGYMWNDDDEDNGTGNQDAFGQTVIPKNETDSERGRRLYHDSVKAEEEQAREDNRNAKSVMRDMADGDSDDDSVIEDLVSDDESSDSDEDELEDEIKDIAEKGMRKAIVNSQGGQGAAAAMKSMFSQLTGAAGRGVAAGTSSIASIGSSIVGGVSSAVSGVASTLGVSFATTAIGTGVVTGGGVLASVLGLYSMMTGKKIDEGVCIPNKTELSSQVQGFIDGQSGEDVDNNEQQYENMLKVWYVCRAAVESSSDAPLTETELDIVARAAAGLIGNFIHESGVDPTNIETGSGMGLKYTLDCPWKKKVIAADFLVADIDTDLHRKYHAEHKKIIRLGIGLGQWSDTTDGSTRHTDLREYATANNKEWCDIDLQLQFMFDAENGDNKSSVKILTDMLTVDQSPEDAAEYIQLKWEICLDGGKSTPDRKTGARTAYEYIQLHLDDTEGFGASVIGDMITSQGNFETSIKNAIVGGMFHDDGCGGMVSDHTSGGGGGGYGTGADMSSMVNLALSLAWETRAESFNKGTPTYQKLAADSCPGLSPLRCCATVTTVIVRASGADPNYPSTAAVGTSQTYFNSDKGKESWLSLGKIPQDELQPGDIGLRKDSTHSHIWMYVGNEAVRKKFPNSDCDYIHGSIAGATSAGRSAHLANWNYGDKPYEIYRLKSMPGPAPEDPEPDDEE